MAIPDRLASGQGIALSIDATDFQNAAAALDRGGFTMIAEKRVKHALRQSADSARFWMRRFAQRHRKTGRFIRSFHTTWKGAGLNFMLRVGSTDPVAHLIIPGVHAHRELSRRPMPIGGVHPYAEAVMHPGFPGDPIVSKALRKAKPEIQGFVDKAADLMVSDLAKKLNGKKRRTR